ncbi:hypothetical protein MAFF301560_32510 [Ralstonia solanacearum]|nr:hypothetical protein MAFF301560_32510 [Ralstonia solanacearum]BEU45384.1 hypothetical protein MAFF211519_07090 [Ralstonia pseudosolanacearum]
MTASVITGPQDQATTCLADQTTPAAAVRAQPYREARAAAVAQAELEEVARVWAAAAELAAVRRAARAVEAAARGQVARRPHGAILSYSTWMVMVSKPPPRVTAPSFCSITMAMVSKRVRVGSNLMTAG